MLCTEAEFFKHRDEIDSSPDLVALIASVRGTTASSCDNSFGTSPDVPAWDADNCYTSAPNREESTFSCSELPTPKYMGKHRLCYCHTQRRVYFMIPNHYLTQN